MSFHHFDPPTPTGSRPLSSSSNNSDSLRTLTNGLKRSPKPRFFRRCEQICCSTVTYFPLLIVYGATTWAVWVEAWSISLMSIGGKRGTLLASIGFFLYVMMIWSYTVATFTSPGTPLGSKHSYSHLPTSDIASSTVTVKASGEERFCKKCQSRKPDRAHHCSSCNTCVLKMDHHCPWLANCIGLWNYKCFILFTGYLSLFCIFDCAVSTIWLWDVYFKDSTYMESFMPINWVLLSLISGIVGLVISGFTGWHLMLVYRAETTIESLEKTRYLSPLRRPTIPPGAQFLGGDHAMGPDALANRERERYNQYIIEETSKQMPNAFDLGMKLNFQQVFGDKWILWGVPIRNSLGDGWTWSTSEAWKEAQRELIERKAQEAAMERERSLRAGWGGDTYAPPTIRPKITKSAGSARSGGTSKASRMLGAAEEEFTHGLGGSRYSPNAAAQSGELANAVRMQDLKKKPTSRLELSEDEDDDDYESSSDETEAAGERRKLNTRPKTSKGAGEDEDWAAGW